MSITAQAEEASTATRTTGYTAKPSPAATLSVSLSFERTGGAGLAAETKVFPGPHSGRGS